MIWSILSFELVCEFLVRPSLRSYRALIRTDKAFTPTTARHINTFHLICEGVALLLYIPNVSCVLAGTCDDKLFLSGAEAAKWAVTSPNDAKATISRFLLGLTFLRTFGLVRHWKQMWINYTFEGRTDSKPESCKSIKVYFAHVVSKSCAIF